VGIVAQREAFARFRDTFDPETAVVFTNGCFDLLHPGHFRLLRYARSLGDMLVVGMNSDASVRRLKGPDRPVAPQEARAAALCALDSVDIVIVFDELDPVATIRAVRPAIHVKGGDYDVKNMPEAEVVASLGGKVVIMPRITELSSTTYIERARSHAKESER
jgi:D-beta-D-heptose 7-phosphate kinase/D-beta-D-heptose 1-phosphate adenosyltransferase